MDCCLVALAFVSDLLLWAKHLFVRAMVAIVPGEDQDAKRNRWMNWKTETLAFVFAVAALSGHANASRGEDSTDPSRFTYARLYCGPDGNSHFQDVTAELRKTDFAPPAPPVHIGSDFSAARAFFGGFDARWGAQDLENRLNHPTPAVQFGIVLQGSFSITVTDGETRQLRPATCSGWRTLHLARDTSRSWATSPDSSCSSADSPTMNAKQGPTSSPSRWLQFEYIC
jgi:hypothetical protein